MPSPSHRTALRTHSFTESVIREMTRVAREHDAVNLAQGFPDYPAPDVLKEAACRAIREDVNQYAITWGAPSLRDALVRKYASWYGLEVDGTREVTVTCGATEAMAAVMLALVDPGDEVIVLEPFYENYGPDAILSQAKPVFLRLEAPEYRLDLDALESLVTPRTRAIVLNTPNNPTGRVFDAEELEGVARICRTHDILAITDEIYEHIHYQGRHIPLATLEGMRERTITISGASKTFSVTGWRIGTIIAPAPLTDAIRKVHDFLTVGAPAPLQEACAVGMNELGPEYYEGMVAEYRERRDVMVRALAESGFRAPTPEGAYYILADFSALSGEDDRTFAKRLTREAGVAPVPGSSFFSDPQAGRTLVRFVFCKRLDTLREAGERLVAFAGRGA
ncbi:MAG: aminotransferase class I/II-fold pyridoxal phosphate-dependent enzyme [Gemmatimonadota bacterium]|nr:aminotransferase class I/II-fold pyridoxal phosphate-dependent enzyme [Gemmatimonadota bacterium]MDH5761084.1 aminotransferase class I/II-fold pyridoxal phosphate-dependent enzyme [Gemmatimonadota bacterium]